MLQTGQPADARETQLLVDEEQEDSQSHDDNAHRRQEANGLWGDCQEEGEGKRTHNDTLIRPHEQTVWTHTVRMAHMVHKDRMGHTLVFCYPQTVCLLK